MSAQPNQREFSSDVGRTKLNDVLDLIDENLLKPDRLRYEVRPEDCVLVLHVHLLPSMVPFFERLIQLGFQPSSIVVVGKGYSAVPWVRQGIAEKGCTVISSDNRSFSPGFYDQHAKRNLKEAVNKALLKCRSTHVRRCILVDDGGFLTSTWCAYAGAAHKFDLISIQQTESGLYWRRNYASACRVNVARSTAKVFLSRS
jgi:hypothetical protein